MLSNPDVVQALFAAKRLSAADVARELEKRGEGVSRQQAWRLLTGARRPTDAQQPLLDEILALGEPRIPSELEDRRPLFAIARLADGVFAFLFLLGGGGGFRLPVFVNRQLADYVAEGLARVVPDVVAV